MTWFGTMAAALSSSVEDGVLNWAAMLAFYFLFALFPTVLLVAALLGVFHATGIVNNLVATLNRNLPHPAAQLVASQLHDLLRRHVPGLISFDVIVLIYSASQGFTALMEGLDVAYEVQETRSYGRRLWLSFILTISAGVLLALALVLLVLGKYIFTLLAGRAHAGFAVALFWPLVRWGGTFGFMVLAVFLLYRYAPDVRHEMSGLLPAVATAMVIWVIASTLLGTYMDHFANYSAVYGSLGAIIALMLWLYVLALAVLFGAELHGERLKRRGIRYGHPR